MNQAQPKFDERWLLPGVLVPVNMHTISACIQHIVSLEADLVQHRAFVDLIQDATGPYQDLDGHRIVADARRLSNG